MNMLRKAAPFFAVGVFGALYACSGTTVGGGGSGSATGTVAGSTFTVASEIGINSPALGQTSCTSAPDGGATCTSSSSGQAVGVLLTNRAAADCGLLLESNPDTNFANFAYLSLGVVSGDGTVGPGTYAIAGGNVGASEEYATSSATCEEALDVTATSGSITLTEVSATSVAGTYDVTFGTQGSFTGSFEASVCTLPDGGISTGGSTACVP